MDVLQLYFDDSGSRSPDHKPVPRKDGIDCFALGGVLINHEDLSLVRDRHGAFCEAWGITPPVLHSTRIRTRQKSFAWLGLDAEREKIFLSQLGEFLLGLPVLCIACAVHRPGYNARYYKQYSGQPWRLCKTAFGILIERAAKHALRVGRKLQIFYEQSGAREDTDIVEYLRSLKREGMPFDPHGSAQYQSLGAEDFQAIVLGEPHRITKENPMAQAADLLLYPMIKGRYEPKYRSYCDLKAHGKLIDCVLSEEEAPMLGIKYSCFDGIP
jgi:hypothetical protein